jgi:aldehyde:ferredoxin oxidoreductase
MGNGYHDRVLRVDLTARRIWTETVGEETWRAFLGGAGYGAKVLLDESFPGMDPLGPDNPLVFALGPYQAGNAPGNAKWSVVAKSPLTGTYGDSAAGARWGVELKKAGYDAIVVKGASTTPVYLMIQDGEFSLKDAQDLWGLDAYQTVDALKERETDPRLAVACIGPAGEKMVRIACIVADGHSFAGRTGLGAVMGSKGLKAIAVRGTGDAPVHDPQGYAQASKARFREILQAARDNGLREHGTPNLCVTAEAFGDMPIKNWTGDVWPEGAARLGAPNYTTALGVKPLPCVNCPVGCHRSIEVKAGRYKVKGPGPEYETLGMLGTNLYIDDPEAVALANDICNRLGIDTISAGTCVGVAMECQEQGYLSQEKSGMDLSWGNAESAITLVEKIGKREGFGDLFALGPVAAAKAIRPGMEEHLVANVKGLDLPAHDARACWSLGINYATSTRGACHMRGVTEDVEMGGFFIPEIGVVKDWSLFFSPEHKSEMACKLQDYCAFMNSLVICAFMVNGGDLSMTSLIDLVNKATGWGWDVQDVMETGSRIFTAQRLVNIRDGHSRATDTLPYKMTVKAKEGFRAGKAPVPFHGYLDEYYSLRGWDEKGYPTREILKRLGLEKYDGMVPRA